ncbi:MAG: nitronate monooxygenase, partial [Parvibaculum sp.]
GGNMKQKAWKDIWGSGQGIGQIKDAPPVAELVERMKREYVRACREFAERMPPEALSTVKVAAE